jgi:hypothetical protein
MGSVAHQSAAGLCVVVVFAIGTGAWSAGRGGWPALGHVALAGIAAVVLLALVAGMARAGWARPVRGLVWSALALLALEAWTGWTGLRVVHASLAPVLFSALVVVVVATGPGRTCGPEVGSQPRWARVAVIAVLPLVFTQIVLGVASRHAVLGVLWHLECGVLVVFLLLRLPGIVGEHFGEGRGVRRAARLAAAVGLVQAMLGLIAYAMALIGARETPGGVVAATLHAVGGALTLAACAVMALAARPRGTP